MEPKRKVKSSKAFSSTRPKGHSKSWNKKKENEDPNKQAEVTIKKFKYFSKKNKNHEEPKHKSYNSGKTVEVFLFDNKIPKTESKKRRDKSPFNKSEESTWKKYKTKHESHFSTYSQSGYTPSTKTKKSTSKPKICLPVYQKYINQVKRVATSSKLKELHKRMHSWIMNSFVSSKEMSISGLNTMTKGKEKSLNSKASSSFVFPSKSPLNMSINAPSQNFISKNKKSLRTLNYTAEWK